MSAREQLVVALARTNGLLALPPREIVQAMSALPHARSVQPSAATTPVAPAATAEKPARATRTSGSAAPPRDRGGSRDATDDGDDWVSVTVKVSCNVGAEKRGLLESAGLRWNGKRGTWLGRVDTARAARLREAFPDRVTTHSPPAPAEADRGSRAAGPDAAIATGDGPIPARPGAADVSGPAAAPPPVDPAVAPAVGAAVDGTGAAGDAAGDAPARPAPVQGQPVVPVADGASNPPRPAAGPFAGFRRATARR